MIRIIHVDIVLIDRIERDSDLLISDGTIGSVGGSEVEKALSRSNSIEDLEVVDASGKYLVPGYIDLHFHGADHYLVDNGADDLAALCELLPRFGVTSFLPAVIPQPRELHTALVAELASRSYTGSRINGFFLEGPFLKLTGALPKEALEGLSSDRIDSLKQAAAPYSVVFAVAPDVEGAIDLIPMMAANTSSPNGTAPVFITHTAASVAETEAGIAAGISHATHFYDVFPIPPETEPGVRPCGAVEAILADPSVTVDFILDGEHVDPIATRMALETKGPGGVSLVTDANIGAGLPPGVHQGAGGEVVFAYEGGPARMTENSKKPGCLAGSGLTMDRAVRNAISMLGVDLVQAVRMASANPASVLGLDASTGSIDVGKRADLLLLDSDLRVERCWVDGTLRFDGVGRPGKEDNRRRA